MDNENNGYATSSQVFWGQVKFALFAGVVIFKNNIIKILSLMLLAGIIFVLFWGENYFSKPEIKKASWRIDNAKGFETICIPKGISSRAVLDSLYNKKLITNYNWSLLLIKAFEMENVFKAGKFDIPDSLNDYQTLYYLSKAPMKLLKITIPEGLTYHRVASLFEKKEITDSIDFVSLCENLQFIGKLGLNKIDNLEGYILADTYFFPYGMSPEQILNRIVGETVAIFQSDSVVAALKELSYNRHQILTLASIVEGEVIYHSEAPQVAGVYHNRLNKRWKLQADPTIQYILPGPPRRLFNKDLEIKSPYNTYKYRGLPPGPINNPGRASIMAAIFPDSTNYMYFVATGDGYHHFSKTLREHNNWKRKFNRIRRKLYGK